VGLVLTVATAGCTWQGSSTTPPAPAVEMVSTPSEFARVSAGPVNALVPPDWRAIATSAADATRQGFVASPRPQAWGELDGGITGLSATWVDATQVGVPSDYYYLAATGPLLTRLVASEQCRTLAEQVYVDHAPAFAQGTIRSSGDYVARGEGVCGVPGRRATRWAYFVAAPGLGPARQVGIPRSGLYVVVAVAPANDEADGLLEHLLGHTRFGDASIRDFVRSIRAE